MTAPERVLYRLALPFERPPKALSANFRGHWRRRSADVRLVRETVLVLAKRHGLHRVRAEHVTVSLVWAPGDRRRRDAINLFPMLKAACDALARGPRRDWVGLELVPDDTPRWMTTPTPVIEPPPAKGMWLLVELLNPRPVSGASVGEGGRDRSGRLAGIPPGKRS